jgi:hypothetical protein
LHEAKVYRGRDGLIVVGRDLGVPRWGSFLPT